QKTRRDADEPQHQRAEGPTDDGKQTVVRGNHNRQCWIESTISVETHDGREKTNTQCQNCPDNVFHDKFLARPALYPAERKPRQRTVDLVTTVNLWPRPECPTVPPAGRASCLARR